MQAYTNESGFAEFTAAREQFDLVVDALCSEAARSLEHGEGESLIVQEGNAVLRCLMQGYLYQRAIGEERPGAVVGQDGHERRQIRVDPGISISQNPIWPNDRNLLQPAIRGNFKGPKSAHTGPDLDKKAFIEKLRSRHANEGADEISVRSMEGEPRTSKNRP